MAESKTGIREARKMKEIITDKDTSKDNCETKPINLKPALHRRILNFLNEAISPADLEYEKPLFIHDHEGVPIHKHGPTVSRKRILERDIAQKIIDFRNLEYPLGFRNLKELLPNGLLDSEVLDTLSHHLGEINFGEWSKFPQPIPRRGPGEFDGVVHAALLHTGSILFITADETTLLWNPEDVTPTSFQDPRNQPHTMPGGYSQLCGHHVFLSDGRLLTVGGGGYSPNPVARWGYKFDPLEKTWTRTSNEMSDSRWYPTAVALGDRRVLVVCGHGSGEMDTYNEKTDKFTRVELDLKRFPSLYPGLHLLPNNSIFYSRTGWGSAFAGNVESRQADDQSAYFTFTGTNAGVWNPIKLAPPDIAERTKGMSVMLLINRGPGKGERGPARPPNVRILVFGGADPNTNNTYEVIDASSLSPDSSWSNPIPFPDSQHRSLCSAVLLPDGNVFISGGIQGTNSPCTLFDPRANEWSRSAEMQFQRDYHSVSLLLPSGKVMMAGWMNSTIEVYSPPYLFHGPRPSIRSAPDVVRHGQSFNIETPEAESIGRTVFVRPMAVTHQTDSEQRVIELPFVRDQAQHDRLVLTAPNGGAPYSLAPGGYYMLFILNGDGVPSVAKWIRLDSSMHAKPGATVTALLPFEGHVDLFATALDGTVMSTFYEGDHWRDWFPIHGEVKMQPGATVTVLQPFEGHVDLFATAPDGTVMSTFFEGGNWLDWFPIHGEVKMQPGATVTVLQPFEGHVDLFTTDPDGTVMSTFFEGQWRNWFPIS